VGTLLSDFEAPAVFGGADILTGNILEDAEVVKLRFLNSRKDKSQKLHCCRQPR